MKKIIFSMALATIAFAVQAGADKACSDKAGSSCCSEAKVSTQTKTECTMGKQAKASCPNSAKIAKVTAAKPLQSPKAFASR
jgi:hypothetical protein